MPNYEVYGLDGSGRVVKRLDVPCADDLEAFKRAYDFCGDYDFDLWQGDRKLYVLARGAKLPRVLSEDA